jgi:hypothetical protein
MSRQIVKQKFFDPKNPTRVIKWSKGSMESYVLGQASYSCNVPGSIPVTGHQRVLQLND